MLFAGARLRKLREEAHLSQEQLAEKTSVHVNTIRRWEQGKATPNADRLAVLSGVLGNGLMQDISSDVTTVDIKWVPIIKGTVRACCGPGNAYADDIEWDEDGAYPIPSSTLMGYTWQVEDGGFKSIRVEGDSMEPRIEQGDLLLFAKMELRNGDIGLVKFGDRLIIRGVFFEKKKIRLKAINKNYEDIIVNSEDDFCILGKILLRMPKAEILAGGML